MAHSLEIAVAPGHYKRRKGRFGAVGPYDYRIKTQLLVRRDVDAVEFHGEAAVKEGFGTLHAHVAKGYARRIERRHGSRCRWCRRHHDDSTEHTRYPRKYLIHSLLRIRIHRLG